MWILFKLFSAIIRETVQTSSFCLFFCIRWPPLRECGCLVDVRTLARTHARTHAHTHTHTHTHTHKYSHGRTQNTHTHTYIYICPTDLMCHSPAPARAGGSCKADYTMHYHHHHPTHTHRLFRPTVCAPRSVCCLSLTLQAHIQCQSVCPPGLGRQAGGVLGRSSCRQCVG